MYKKPYLTGAIKNSKGYSFIELMMVLSIIAVVAQIGFTAWLDYKRRAYDTAAVSDTRNLIEAIVNDMVGAEDVIYNHLPDEGPRIGAYRNQDGAACPPCSKGESKSPSLFLSPGVKADITGSTAWIDTTTGIQFTYISGFLWHAGGTPWTGVGNSDGIREFTAIVDEENELIEFIGLKMRSSE